MTESHPTEPHPAEPQSPAAFEDGALRSTLYGDIYFSMEDGLAESRAVFLKGCGLPEAWRGRCRFTVAELGFGTGLNIAALLDLWEEAREDGTVGAGAHLHIFSLEAHPLTREEALRALEPWPALSHVTRLLLDRWPGKRRGFHRIDLPELSATVDVAVMEAAEALAAWTGKADAWFLDGFSPALNPAMWREEVLQGVAARSAPGARAATFTVAGAVRRGLEGQGFTVEKLPGHGRKRQRLEARLPGEAPPAREPSIAIVGAGIAGASLARAFAVLGLKAQVFADPAQVAASGNPAALVTPALDAGGGPRAALYAQAFARAVTLYNALDGAVIATGALQLEAEPRDEARFDKVAVQDLFEPETLSRLDAADVAAILEEPPAAGGLLFEDGLVVEPALVLQAWAPIVDPRPVVSAGGGVLTFAGGEEAGFDAIVLACGYGAGALCPTLGLTPVRGQASLAEDIDSGVATAFGAYAIPTRTGVLFGATHDRGDTLTDVRPADHQRNLTAVAVGRPHLAAALQSLPLAGRAALRATTPDRLPIAGEVAPGLFVLTGLGSRGFTTAPLLAEHVAALIAGVPSPLPAPLAALVAPREVQP